MRSQASHRGLANSRSGKRPPVRKWIPSLVVAFVLAALVLPLASAAAPSFSWQLTPTGSTARLRGLSAVSAQVAWASGSLGTVLRTVDAGQNW